MSSQSSKEDIKMKEMYETQELRQLLELPARNYKNRIFRVNTCFSWMRYETIQRICPFQKQWISPLMNVYKTEFWQIS